MQIVIDIDDMAHDWLVNGFPDEDDMEMALRAIKNGTVLSTGHWIGIDEEPHEDYECDVCGHVVSTWTANIKPQDEYKFCPNCGADMRGGQDDNRN